MLRRMMPPLVRDDRTATTPCPATFFSSSKAGAVMLPSPTPATTIPFAPFFAAR
jgi:hypothetical protein